MDLNDSLLQNGHERLRISFNPDDQTSCQIGLGADAKNPDPLLGIPIVFSYRTSV